ncbi:MAG: redoxin family protein [Planctomycetota bacterium]|nr:redoxin family protein [Planctomycetota bacterium]
MAESEGTSNAGGAATSRGVRRARRQVPVVAAHLDSGSGCARPGFWSRRRHRWAAFGVLAGACAVGLIMTKPWRKGLERVAWVRPADRSEFARRVRSFALEDADGGRHTAAEWRGRTGVVLFFLGRECPVSNAYAPEMERLAGLYRARGVAFYGVYCDPDIDAATALDHARRFGIGFTTLLDPARTLADQVGVRVTPEAAVLDEAGRVLYRGRIDDRYALDGKRAASARVHDLEDALKAVVDDLMPRAAYQSAFGCPLEAVASSDVVATTASAVTYARDVAPLLLRSCVGCHRPGEVAPFPLLVYRDAAKRAGQIADVVESRRMPPWKAMPGHGVFLDDPTLSAIEVDTLRRWADAGAPEGDPRDLPKRTFEPDGPRLGRPDLVLEPTAAFDVPAGGDDVFRAYVLPLPRDRDLHVAAFDFHPGNRRVVHHAKLYLDRDRRFQAAEDSDPAAGFDTQAGAELGRGAVWEWTPGTVARRAARGVGTILPRGADLVLFIHYHPDGRPESDRSRIQIYLSETPVEKRIAGVPMGTSSLDIPAGEANYTVVRRATLPADVRVLAALPHGHFLMRQIKLTATLPDGEVIPMLWIDDWDFNWQGRYAYAKPLALPKGTRLELTARYDNSSANPLNPHRPPQRVRFGPASTDEMLGCHLQVIAETPEGYRAIKSRWPEGF